MFTGSTASNLDNLSYVAVRARKSTAWLQSSISVQNYHCLHYLTNLCVEIFPVFILQAESAFHCRSWFILFPKTLGFIKSDSLPFIIDTPSGQFLFCHGDRIAPAFGHIDQQGKVREAEYIIGIQLIGQFFFLFSRSPAISARQTDHPRPVAVPKAEVRPYRLLEDSGWFPRQYLPTACIRSS